MFFSRLSWQHATRSLFKVHYTKASIGGDTPSFREGGIPNTQQQSILSLVLFRPPLQVISGSIRNVRNVPKRRQPHKEGRGGGEHERHSRLTMAHSNLSVWRTETICIPSSNLRGFDLSARSFGSPSPAPLTTTSAICFPIRAGAFLSAEWVWKVWNLTGFPVGVWQIMDFLLLIFLFSSLFFSPCFCV